MESPGTENCSARGIRNVQRSARRAGLSRGPKRPLQSDIQHSELCGVEFSDQSCRASPGRGEISSWRCAAEHADADADIVVVARTKGTLSQYSAHGRIRGLA